MQKSSRAALFGVATSLLTFNLSCRPGRGELFNHIAPVDNPGAGLPFPDAVPAGSAKFNLSTPRVPSGNPCARLGADKVRAVFCNGNPPKIRSLVELQTVLGLGPESPNRRITLTGHSTSLTAQYVTQINPRLIVFTAPTGGPDPNYVALAFNRGTQSVEVIANDSVTNEPAFFLFGFEQSCNDRENGCRPQDLFTEKVEKNWTKLVVSDDSELENTVFDCKQCHQHAGPGTKKILLMQELSGPWSHYFSRLVEGGEVLISEYFAAHPIDEGYAGVSSIDVYNSDPESLQNLIIQNGFDMPPNRYLSDVIQAEVKRGDPRQPAINETTGWSPTWDLSFAAFARGEAIPVPHSEIKTTNETALRQATELYRAFVTDPFSQESEEERDFPDLTNLMKFSAQVGSGMRMTPDLPATSLIVQACGQCHNSRLNPSISRANFNADLARTSRAAKDSAIRRLYAADDEGKMPPTLFRALTDEERERIVAELEK